MLLCSAACLAVPAEYYAGQTYKFTTDLDPNFYGFYWKVTCCSDEACCIDPTCCVNSNCGSNTGINHDPFVWTAPNVKCPTDVAISVLSSNKAYLSCKSETEINITVLPLSGFSGRKFEDKNGNAVRDAGEPGLEGWTINLTSGSTIIANTTTGAGGAYSFTNITPGSYTVSEAIQPGWNQSYPAAPGTQTVTLVSGEAGPTNIDFGNWRPTGFSGTVFEDRNADGVRDPGESGLEGWTVNLMSGSTIVANITTGPGGVYSFTNIAPGSYTVSEAIQPGWTQSYPVSPGTQSVTLVSGESGPTDVDFGNWRPAGFSGVKFEDLNGDGIRDADEPGLEGWTINLTSGSTVIANTTTGSGGAYSFTNITPGSYTVSEAIQPGWTQSYPAAPGTLPVTLASGEAGPTNIDFGNWRPTGFSGTVFEDRNADGVRDAGEPGLEGWTVNLMSGSTIVANTTTGSGGSYSFTNIPPGSYTVVEVIQSGWTQSYPVSPGTQSVTLVSGEPGPTDVDFGNWRPTGFSGVKFEDLNGNGARDAGEPGLEGWTINLLSGSTIIANTTTGPDGSYSFTNINPGSITPGSYTVEEVVQAGWNQSYPAMPGMQTVILVSSEAGPTNIDFGNWRPTGFSGTVFEDKNNDGVRDPGELGLEGWTVNLMSGSTIVANTTTGPGGSYSFTNIAPGSYTVVEVIQSGWTQSYPVSPGTQSVTLVSGAPGPTDVDFGNWRPAGFSGVKFEDLNGDGIRDAGEPDLEGWTINLTSGSIVIANTTTGSGGAYSFTNITPGSYTVSEAIQPGWNQSYPASPGTQTVTLVSGEAGPTNIDFGNWRPTGFSGTVFEDRNADGVRDPGESGLEGWTVNLMSGSTIVANTTTGSGGSYSFTNIAPGSYTVVEVIQSGWTQSYPVSPGTQSVTLVSGAPGPTDVDFGNWRPTGFSGVKFEDLNGNGARDAGEPGLEGWTINLLSGSTIIANTTTGSGGAYSFTNITPGSYTAVEAVQNGWTQTYPKAPGTQALNLASGEAGPTNIDFGNVNLTSIGGAKFEDRNADGVRDPGETGLAGWTVNLRNGGIVFATATTGADGAYEFTGIAPGTFTVDEVSQPGWLQTYPTSPSVHTVTLFSGVPGSGNLDFGNVRTAGFGGIKFQDSNGNGARDAGEPGLAGWTVDLKNGGAVIATAITGPDGTYEFSGIIPGNYTIEEEQRLGWIQTEPPGNIYTADISSSGEVVVKRSDSGQTAVEPTEVNFGNQVISAEVSLSGVKFNDSDGDGFKEGNELLGGWTINLMQDGTVVNSTTTSSEAATLGSYKFTGILPGTYTLEEVPSSSTDWTQTYPEKNIYNIVVSENGQIRATASDQTEVASNNLDFGNKYKPSEVEKNALEITKTTPDEIIRPDTQATFVITVKNNGNAEIHDIKIVDELSPMLEFVPYAYSGNIQIQHTFEGGNIVFDLEPLGSLPPGDSWTLAYKVKLSPDACPAGFTPASSAPIVAADETKLKIMAVENGLSSPSEIVQLIDALSRNKTKLEAKLKSIKGHRDAFDKANSTLESGIKSIAAMNFTGNNYTNISGKDRLIELLNATGFLVYSEYSRPDKYDLLVTEYGMNGEVISDFYTFLPTKETLKIEYNKPHMGYKTYTVRYYATGDTLIMIYDFYGNMIGVDYRKTPGLAAPEYLTNCATAYGKMGEEDELVVSDRACANLGWSCKSSGPVASFLLTKVADRDVAQVNDTVKYAFTVQNIGTAVLKYFTLNDDKMGIIVLNDPDPLDPGESRTYYGNYTIRGGDGPKLVNVVIATALDPDGNVVTRKATEYVKILEGCGLTKTASPKIVRPGDYVTYNITWNIAGMVGSEYFIVDDYPQGVSFISATPSPIDDGKNNKWTITENSGTIIIIVQVAQDIGNTSFEMDQGVRGTGFVNVRNDIRTNPVILKNKATLYQIIDGSYVEDCTAFADVNIGPPQTYVALKEHGSGDYAGEEVIRYQDSNRSISVTKGLTATHKPTSFSLPNNRDVDFQSKWSEMAQSKNYATGGSTNEQYTHASRISRNSSLNLDENGSTMKTEADFEGVGHIGLVKKAVEEDKTQSASDVFQSQEDYVGSFKINQKFDEYGKNAEYEKSVNGTGYVSAKRDLGKAQSSYESGTGSYQSEEKISTVTNYISKDINLTHLPTSYIYTPTFSTSSDLKWSEGMWSKTPTSLISEQFSSATNLSLHRAARGLNEMATEASVTGQADFRTAYRGENGNDTIDQQETYVGNFDIKRKTSLGGVAKYDRPHISLSKMAKVDLLNSTIADYRITIENNGNRALEPVYVMDVFPDGTEYITSSLRPAELTGSYANWSLPAMGIGSKVIIDLQLNITEEPSNLVNRVQAAGKYDEMWTLARNFSISNLKWLTCCPPQISASKTARIDSLDPKVVWYTLNLKNREKYTMVAFWMDRLPLSMGLLNSSLEPSENRSGLITWTILDLAPGENRSIVYRTRAEADGTYINTAHIEAFSVDGPDAAAADVEARINLGEGVAVASSSSSDWQPPTCFGLNCSGKINDEDWVPCYTCGMGENGGGVAMPPCASCIDTGDDSLP